MGRQRFRKLERADGAPTMPDTERDAPPTVADAAARARSLEREGELRLDDAPRETDFCRYCRFENRAGVARCLNCGSSLGGPDQERFDEEMRARREAKREAEPMAAPGAAAGADAGEAELAAGHAVASLDVAQLLRAAERDEPGFGTVIASGVLVACIFALLSIPVRRIFGGPQSAGTLELIVLVALTASVYASVRRRIAKL